MNYVKLIAKPNTWFKEGTEVFHYDDKYEVQQRITVEEYENWKEWGYILCRGIRIVECPAAEGTHLKVGEEITDGECCSLDEFEIEFV